MEELNLMLICLFNAGGDRDMLPKIFPSNRGFSILSISDWIINVKFQLTLIYFFRNIIFGLEIGEIL